MRRALLPADSPAVANSLLGLGSTYVNSGRPGQAEPLLREALRIFTAALPGDHWQIAETRAFLGLCLSLEGRYPEAEAALLENRPYRNPDTAQSRRTLQAMAFLYDSWGKGEQARKARAALAE